MVKVVVRDKKKKDVTEKTRKKITHRRVAGGEWEKVTDKNRNDKWAGGGVKTNKATADFDRAVKAGTMLSAKKETERKKRSKELGIKYIPGRELPKTETKDDKPLEKQGIVREDLTEEQRALIEGGTINEGSNLAGQPLMTDQPKGVQALQTGLLDIATTGGAGSIVRGGSKVGKEGISVGKSLGVTIKENVDRNKGTILQRIKSNLGFKVTDKQLQKIGKTKSGDLEGLLKKWGITGTGMFVFSKTMDEQSIMMWGAVDNVAGGANIGSKALLDQVTFADIPPSPEDVEETKERLRNDIKMAKNTVRTAAWINPIMAYSRYKRHMDMIKSAEGHMEENFISIDKKMGLGQELETTEETTDL